MVIYQESSNDAQSTKYKKYSYEICITEFAINVRNDNPRPLYTSWHACETHQFTRTGPLQGTQHPQCGGAMHLVFPCSLGTPSLSLYAMKAYGGVNAYLQPIFNPVRLRYHAVRSDGSSVPTQVRFRFVLCSSLFLYLQTTETFLECNLSLYRVFQVTNARHSTSLTDGCSAQDRSYRLNYKCSSPTILGRLSELTTSWYKIDILHLYAYRTAKLITAGGDLQETAYNEEKNAEIQN